jgi:hypothetical protein
MTLGTPPSEDSHLPSFDPSVPNPARMWNYWLGGKDNFAVDREAAEHGVRQFLDIGTGLPTADNTHDVAQRAAPESKIVYVDYDPVVLTHAQAPADQQPGGCDRRFFAGLDLLPPGLVPINQWALTGHIDATTGALVGYSAIARKP